MSADPTEDPSSPLAAFLHALLTRGDVVVPPASAASAPTADAQSESVLREFDHEARSHLSGTAPSLDLTAALWAARQFYAACQCAVTRDLPPDSLTTLLSGTCPSAGRADVHYSVDLIFRHLPALHDLLTRTAPGDPLVGILNDWARAWPLSSVGIPLDESPSLDNLAGQPALWRLYVDRVARVRAEDRWRDPRVATQIREDLGAHPDLAPALAAALERTTGMAHSGLHPA